MNLRRLMPLLINREYLSPELSVHPPRARNILDPLIEVTRWYRSETSYLKYLSVISLKFKSGPLQIADCLIQSRFEGLDNRN